MHTRLAESAFTGLLISLLCGCWGSKLDLHPVTGTVKYEDGSVPQGEMSTITFTPATEAQGKAAFSDIQPDGSFELWTLERGDGALAGPYRVTLNVIQGYPRGKSLVGRQFTDLMETPLEATVKAGRNEFDFVVQKPPGR